MTSLEIANTALTRLGATTISSLNENTPNARVCNLRYELCKKTVLRMHPWNFAMKRVSLPSVTSYTPPFEYAYAHLLPTDCLRLIECSSSNYRIEERYIVCDDNGVDIRYIKNITDFTGGDVLLIESIATYLAWDIALKVTQSREIQSSMLQAWNGIVIKAKSVDAQEEPVGQILAETYTGARQGETLNPRIPLRDYPEYPL